MDVRAANSAETAGALINAPQGERACVAANVVALYLSLLHVCACSAETSGAPNDAPRGERACVAANVVAL
jgi:hypothetical protein